MSSATLPVSPIGLGCVTFGREIDEATSFQLLDHAIANGITFLDTAAAYASGASETILGRWLATRVPAPGSIVIATKLQPPFDARHIIEGAENCLKRLSLPVIDLLYLHRWDPSGQSIETLTALDTLVRSGKVRAIGVSNYTLDQLQAALALQHAHSLTPFSFVQNNHNLAVREVTPEFQTFCAANNIAIVTYSPLAAGFLTGKHRQGVQPGSRFDVIPGHQDVYFNALALQRLSQLEKVAARTGLSQTHLALAWALHQPGITSVLIGGRTPAHIDQALAAKDFQDLAILAELLS